MGEEETGEVLGRVRREDSKRWKQMESWGAGEWNDGFGFCEIENWGAECIHDTLNVCLAWFRQYGSVSFAYSTRLRILLN